MLCGEHAGGTDILSVKELKKKYIMHIDAAKKIGVGEKLLSIAAYQIRGLTCVFIRRVNALNSQERL